MKKNKREGRRRFAWQEERTDWKKMIRVHSQAVWLLQYTILGLLALGYLFGYLFGWLTEDLTRTGKLTAMVVVIVVCYLGLLIAASRLPK